VFDPNTFNIMACELLIVGWTTAWSMPFDLLLNPAYALVSGYS